MSASEIMCLIFLLAGLMVFLSTMGVLINWLWNKKISNIMLYIAFGIICVVFLGIFIGAIISLVVIL